MHFFTKVSYFILTVMLSNFSSSNCTLRSVFSSSLPSNETKTFPDQETSASETFESPSNQNYDWMMAYSPELASSLSTIGENPMELSVWQAFQMPISPELNLPITGLSEPSYSSSHDGGTSNYFPDPIPNELLSSGGYDYSKPLPSDGYDYGKPHIHHSHGHGYFGGLKNLLAEHKLKKHLKHYHRGLFRKHKFGRHYGYHQLDHLRDVTSYAGDLALHLTNGISQIGNNFQAGSYDLETTIFKSFLIPLAGIALLGSAGAAMLVTNPFIWSLPFSLFFGGNVGHFGLASLGLGLWKRSDTDSKTEKELEISEEMKRRLHEIKILDDYLKQASTKTEIINQEKKILANYLMTQAVCLERMVCSLHQPRLTESLYQERTVMNVVTNEILQNEYVPRGIHENILRARQVGLVDGNCQIFPCHPLNFAYRQR